MYKFLTIKFIGSVVDLGNLARFIRVRTPLATKIFYMLFMNPLNFFSGSATASLPLNRLARTSIKYRTQQSPDSSECHRVIDDSNTSIEKTAPDMAPTAAPRAKPLSVSWPIKAPVMAPNKVPTFSYQSYSIRPHREGLGMCQNPLKGINLVLSAYPSGTRAYQPRKCLLWTLCMLGVI